jgi:hypothetical protein
VGTNGEDNKVSNKVIVPLSGTAYMSQGYLEVWRTYSFAEAWYCDTVVESKQDGADHRRKEIVFAVCFVESYLFEFVRDRVFVGELKATQRIFPVNRRIGITKRCKKVFNQLCQEKKIKKQLDWGSTMWAEFEKLVTMRGGLVHASVSRPTSASLTRDARPIPDPEDLHRIQAAWPLRVAHDVAIAMHDAAEIDPPSWLHS